MVTAVGRDPARRLSAAAAAAATAARDEEEVAEEEAEEEAGPWWWWCWDTYRSKPCCTDGGTGAPSLRSIGGSGVMDCVSVLLVTAALVRTNVINVESS